MFAFFRRMSKSTIGTIIMVLFLLAIVASFALADIQGTLSGGMGGGPGTLAKAGDAAVTERDLSAAMQRRLAEVRQQNPEADYSALAGDFDPILGSLIRERALQEFARDNDIFLSRRLIDAEIAKIPATRGLDGKFSPAAYASFLQQQRMTDAELRQLIAGDLTQRLVLATGAANARIPLGVATPYASMLLEAREAEVSLVPTEAFAAGIPEPTAADIQSFYASNRDRYMVPEQRVLNIARIGPEQVASVAASEQEITSYYNANQAIYGGKAIRVISQAVVPSKQAADAIVGRARSGQSFVAATAPAGFSAADISVGPQTREEFARLAGDRVAAAAFAAREGAIVGPIQSDLGWHIVKIDAVRTEAGRSLASVRGEIATKLTAEKRKAALEELVDKVQTAIDDDANFAEAIRGIGVTPIRTPALTAGGVSRSQPDFKLPAELATALRTGFDLGPDEPPTVETLPGDAGYALVGVEEIIAAAPAPLASIRGQVAEDWKTKQARDRARAAASAIAAKVAKGTALRTAVAESGAGLPPVQQVAMRRLQLSQLGGNVPPAIGMIFSLAQGRSRMVADPQGRGFVIVKVNKITPGDARLQPTLITQTQSEFQQTASGEYAEQLTNAIAADVGVKRNEGAIAAAKRRITGGGGI